MLGEIEGLFQTMFCLDQGKITSSRIYMYIYVLGFEMCIRTDLLATVRARCLGWFVCCLF